MSDAYEVRPSSAASRALAEGLPMYVAAAIWGFLIGPLAANARRVGKPLAGDLAGYFSARRAPTEWCRPPTRRVVSLQPSYLKKPIGAALKAVARDGLAVIEIHRGHRWGRWCARCVGRPGAALDPARPRGHRSPDFSFDYKHRHQQEEGQ